MTIETLVIMMLLSFIFGLVAGVSLVRPGKV
jgi:hypothetical protein